jgi:rare lipoprotein A
MRHARAAALGAIVVGLAFAPGCGPKRAPEPDPVRRGWTQEGIASWYGKPYHGRKTASGERYDMHELTAAHRTLPFGTRVRVVRLDNGRDVVVRITDRGPFHEGRIIDLSKRAAREIGLIEPGTARVRIEVVRTAS